MSEIGTLIPIPVQTAYTREEIVTKAREWMVEQYGIPKEIDNQDELNRWFERFGFLVNFITDHFPSE